MLMPTSSSQEEDTDKEIDDQLADLLTVGPTDELLSPAPPVDLDSGFSGSSSGASYVGSMRRGPDRFKNQSGRSTASGNSGNGGKNSDQNSGNTSGNTSGNNGGGKSFWSRKGWRKLPGLSGLGGSNKASNNGKSILKYVVFYVPVTLMFCFISDFPIQFRTISTLIYNTITTQGHI